MRLLASTRQTKSKIYIWGGCYFELGITMYELGAGLSSTTGEKRSASYKVTPTERPLRNRILQAFGNYYQAQAKVILPLIS